MKLKMQRYSGIQKLRKLHCKIYHTFNEEDKSFVTLYVTGESVYSIEGHEKGRDLEETLDAIASGYCSSLPLEIYDYEMAHARLFSERTINY